MSSKAPEVDAKRRRRAPKVREKELVPARRASEISLYVCCAPYEHGCLCQFCVKAQAVYYCPTCKEFLCEEDDSEIHSYGKRVHHERTRLSAYTLDEAAAALARFTRFAGHLLALQRRCRAVFRRYYDASSYNHYYYNPVYGTSSWRKPYCLRRLELLPFLTEDEAADRIQAMYYGWQARVQVLQRIRAQYTKLFDRRRQHYYYSFDGNSALLQRQSWKKPIHLTLRGYPTDIEPLFTDDVAAIRIQRRWRQCTLRALLCALVRREFEYALDFSDGLFKYYNKTSGEWLNNKPLILRTQLWDPNDVSRWTAEDVILFLRRIGLKEYVPNVLRFAIDGRALLELEEDDFKYVDVLNGVHVRKILVEVERRYPMTAARLKQMSTRGATENRLRKQALERHNFEIRMIVKLQRNFRLYLQRKALAYQRELSAIRSSEATFVSQVESSGVWWLQRKSALPLERKRFISYQKELLRRNTRKPLPPGGWGRLDEDEWVSADNASVSINQLMLQKLVDSGYYKRSES